MKTILFTVCLLFTFCFVSNAYAVNIRGKVLNPDNHTITLMYHEGLLNNNLVRTACKLSAIDNFIFAIPCNSAYLCVELIYGNTRLDLIVDSSCDLYISFDAKDITKTIQFSGYGKSIAEFAFDHQLIFGLNSDRVRAIRSIYISDRSEFSQQLNSMYQKELAYLDSKEMSLPFAFSEYWRSVLLYENYNRQQHYTAYHKYIYQREGLSVPAAKVNTDCINIPFHDYYLNVPEYRLCLKSYHISEMDSIDKDNFSLQIETINRISSVMPKETREFYIASKIYSKQYAANNNYKQLFTFFKTEYPDSKYLPVLNEYYVTTLSKQ